MLILISIGLALALTWLARRYWLLRHGVGALADAVSQGRGFLDEDHALSGLHADWRRLVSATGGLVRENAELREQGAGRLGQLEATLGSLQEGVLIVDRDNYVLLANRAVGRIFPKAQDALGKRVELALHSAEFLALLDEVRGGGQSTQREIEFQESGRVIWIEANGALVPATREANAPWCVFVLHDITRQKELESVRKEFVANVSHELKTPISMIQGYAETLSDDDGSLPPQERMKFAKTIHRHAQRLGAIVEDLLTLSRLESGGEVLRLSWRNAADVLDAAVEEFRGRMHGSGHVLNCVSEPAVVVNIDPLRIGQVWGNLLENALKYTPAGTRIELGVRLNTRRDEAEFWVADNGPGIPAADLPRIFERFYRVEKGRGRDTGGTGLGLSIVKHIVQLHGGRVTADSRVGQGTRISFWLPAKHTDASAPVASEPHPQAASRKP